MSKKLTPWFSGVTPMHVGVYPTKVAGPQSYSIWYSKWDGRQWMADAFYAKDAEDSVRPSMIQNRMWRGLASDPKASKP